MGVVKTFLLPSYGFSFGYKRKGVSIAPLTEAQRNIVGQQIRVNAIPCRRYNPSVKPLKAERLDSSPSIRSEAPSFIVARAAKPLVFGAKHQTQNVCVAKPHKHLA